MKLILFLLFSTLLFHFSCSSTKQIKKDDSGQITIPGVPKNAVTSFTSGIEALKAKDYTLAEKHFNDVITIEPKFFEAYINLAIIKEHSGKIQQAIEYMEQANTQKPNFRLIMESLGKLYVKGARYSDALRMYKTLLDKYPKIKRYTYEMISIYRKKGDFNTAIDLISELTAKNPNDIEALKELGLVYLQQKRYNISIWIYNKALKLSPKHDDMLNNLGFAYLKSNKISAAVASFKKAIEFNPLNISARLNLGAILLEFYDYKEAMSQFNKVLDVNANNFQALMGYAATLLGTSQFKQAADVYKKAIELNPNSHLAAHKLGTIYQERINDPAQALLYYQKYVEIKRPGPADSIHATISSLKKQVEKLNQPQTPPKKEEEPKKDAPKKEEPKKETPKEGDKK